MKTIRFLVPQEFIVQSLPNFDCRMKANVERIGELTEGHLANLKFYGRFSTSWFLSLSNHLTRRIHVNHVLCIRCLFDALTLCFSISCFKCLSWTFEEHFTKTWFFKHHVCFINVRYFNPRTYFWPSSFDFSLGREQSIPLLAIWNSILMLSIVLLLIKQCIPSLI